MALVKFWWYGDDMTKFRRALLAILTFVGLTGASLAVGAGVAFAWHADSTCVNKQWVLTLPDQDWSQTTTATFDFDSGPNQTATKGHSVTATQGATSVYVTYSGSQEHNSYSRPEGCHTIQHQPVTLCHNGHKITVDDDAVVKNGHDGHADDIIPSFTYIGDDDQSHTYPGKNLNKIGLINTGCTAKPSHEPKVVTVDDSTPKCGDTSVATAITTTTYTYTWNGETWVESTGVKVTHGTRTVETEACPTTTTAPPTTAPPTTQPPTTEPPTTQPPVTAPPTVPPTLPPTTVSPVPSNPVLPATGNTSSGTVGLAAILLLAGVAFMLTAVRRKTT